MMDCPALPSDIQWNSPIQLEQHWNGTNSTIFPILCFVGCASCIALYLSGKRIYRGFLSRGYHSLSLSLSLFLFLYSTCF